MIGSSLCFDTFQEDSISELIEPNNGAKRYIRRDE